jgi:hypothetical protein
MNDRTLVVGCGYAGDAHQIEILLPYWTHHQCPVVVMSPIDSPIESMKGHICRQEGLRAYTGQKSLDRQWMQMRAMLEFNDRDGNPFQWFLLNDSDSLVLTPKLPDYLYEDKDAVWSNEVNDFRKPGESWQGQPPWPKDYHAGMPLIAMQPPYFLSRSAMERMVNVASSIKMCPICPFIDWYIVQLTVAAGLKHKPFPTGASCETSTELGIAVMSECISKRGATFIHSVKSKKSLDILTQVYNQTHAQGS